ncbi:MAG TPA: hypothetical protein VLF09_03050 [Cellvibrio sp.]|nr:hypothetical protein [Cellvibrio sp.]
MGTRQDLFAYALQQIRNGKTQEELSEKLNELIQSCRDTEQKGSITLTITVRPDKGDSGQYFLRPEIKLKKPELAIGDTIFWGTPEGNLQRTDPAQGTLDLKIVAEKPAVTKLVDEPHPNVKTI